MQQRGRQSQWNSSGKAPDFSRAGQQILIRGVKDASKEGEGVNYEWFERWMMPFDPEEEEIGNQAVEEDGNLEHHKTRMAIAPKVPVKPSQEK